MKDRIVLIFSVFMVACVLSTLFPCQAQSALSLAVPGTKESLWGQGALKFAELVLSKSKGKLAVACDFENWRQKDSQSVEDLLKAGVDMAFASGFAWSKKVPEIGLFSLPFLFSEPSALKQAQECFPVKTATAMAAKAGIHILGWGELGYRVLTNSKKAVNSPQDIKSMIVRVPPANWVLVSTYEALGAQPKTITWPEVMLALKNGLVTGVDAQSAYIQEPWFHESQKYLTDWHSVWEPLILAISMERWDTLPADNKKIVADAGREACAWQAEEARGRHESNIRGLAEKKIMIVTGFKDVKVKEFQKAVKPVWDLWAANTGAGDLLTKTFKIVQETGTVSPPDPCAEK